MTEHIRIAKRAPIIPGVQFRGSAKAHCVGLIFVTQRSDRARKIEAGVYLAQVGQGDMFIFSISLLDHLPFADYYCLLEEHDAKWKR